MPLDHERDSAAVEASVAACFTSLDYSEGQRTFSRKREPVVTGQRAFRPAAAGSGGRRSAAAALRSCQAG